MIRLTRIIIFVSFFLFPGSAFSQISGTIHYTDGSAVDLAVFDELFLELHYYSSGYTGIKPNKPGDYQKTLPLEKLSQITFIYEKDDSLHDFFYLLTVTGIRSNHVPFKTKVKLWDWMEISSAEDNEKYDTRIIFFHNKKKMKIDRIIFKVT